MSDAGKLRERLADMSPTEGITMMAGHVQELLDSRDQALADLELLRADYNAMYATAERAEADLEAAREALRAALPYMQAAMTEWHEGSSERVNRKLQQEATDNYARARAALGDSDAKGETE